MPKSKGKRKRPGRESGINTSQLESQVATVGTPEQEAFESRLDQYFGSARRLSVPFIEPFRALRFPSIPGEYDLRCPQSTIIHLVTCLTALTPIETIRGLSSLALYIDESRCAIEKFAERLQYCLGQANSLQRKTSYRHNRYGRTVKLSLGDFPDKLFFYPPHVFAAYKRHPEFRGSIIFSHFFLSIALISVYLQHHSVLSLLVLIINLPVVVSSALVSVWPIAIH